MSKIQNLKSLPLVMILFPQWHIFQKWVVFQQSKGRDHGKFSQGQAPGPPFFVHFVCVSFQPPQYEICSNSHRKFFQATAKSNVLSTFCSLSVFLMALLFFFFSSNLWSIYASMLFYVSRDHHHFSYGKGSSKLQIFTLPHTDPARLFCRKSLRCATNKSTKNLGCASAILSILAAWPSPSSVGL